MTNLNEKTIEKMFKINPENGSENEFNEESLNGGFNYNVKNIVFTNDDIEKYMEKSIYSITLKSQIKGTTQTNLTCYYSNYDSKNWLLFGDGVEIYRIGELTIESFNLGGFGEYQTTDIILTELNDDLLFTTFNTDY